MGDIQSLARPFTVATLAEHWGTSDTFVYDQIKAGRLKAMRFGGKLIRIKPEWVEEYECQATDHIRSEGSPGFRLIPSRSRFLSTSCSE